MSAEDESSKSFLEGKGIHVWPRPGGYTIRMDSRGGGGTSPFGIEQDEMDAILSLGRIRLLEYEQTAKDILQPRTPR